MSTDRAARGEIVAVNRGEREVKMLNEWKTGPGNTSAVLFVYGRYPNYWQLRLGTGQIALWRPDYSPVFNWIFGRARQACKL